jgi:HSP20 family protein
MSLPTRRGGYAPQRWSPFRGLPAVDELFDQMSQMLTTAFPETARISVRSWSPPVNIEDADDAYLIDADMPGVRPDDVQVDLHHNELRITGEYGAEQGEGDKGAEGAEGEAGGRQRVRRSGRFDYRLTLPGEVDAASCKADLEDGVLHLRLPKSGEERRRIPVQGATG